MDFAQYVTQHYAGQLAAGVHTPTNGTACALEAYHAWRGEPWSDTPNTIWDFRPLNDGGWSSDAVRAQHLAPVIAAYADCTTWPRARQQAIVEQIVLLTVQQIVAALPGLPDPVRQACRTVTTVTAAAWAAAGAAKAAAWAAAWAAKAAAWNAAGDRPLITMCAIFLAALEEPV